MSFLGSFHDVFAAVSQEILVIVLFYISHTLWKYLGQRSRVGKERKHLPSKPCPPVSLSRKAPAERSVQVVDGKRLQEAQAAEAQMLKWLDTREFTRALNHFRTCERDGQDRHFSEALFSSFMQSAIRVGKLDVVERLVRSIKRQGIVPSCSFWRTTLKMLASRKHFDACVNIHAIFGSSLPADKVVFSCLINGALESGNPKRATDMLPRYREAGLDRKDHVLLFRAYVANNDVDSAEEVFRALGVGMTSLMLNLLLSACVNTRQPERAMERLHEARAFEERRTGVTAAKSPPHEAEEEEERIVDIVSYNTVIKGFAQAGKLSRCFDCLHELLERQLDPDDVTLGTLLDSCIIGNDMDAANEVVDLLVRGDHPVDTLMCTLFIKGLVRAQRLPKALELYEEMKRRNCEGARPDIVTYSVLIKACVDAHDLERALLLVDDMAAAGYAPDDIILTHLLEGCRYVGNHALGKRLFEDMMAAGVKPSEFTLINMIKLHGRCGACEEAYQLVATCEEQYGVKPSVIHHTCLMSGCLRTKNYDQAWQAYALMGQNGIQPDEMTLSTLLPGMVVAQQWERVMTLAKRALQGPAPIRVPAQTLNSALSQMRAAPGQTHHAEQLEKMMREANMQASTRSAARRS